MNLTTCQQYAKARGVAVPTVTLHARKLGIEKIAGRYLFTDDEVDALDGSVYGKPGRPPKSQQ